MVVCSIYNRMDGEINVRPQFIFFVKNHLFSGWTGCGRRMRNAVESRIRRREDTVSGRPMVHWKRDHNSLYFNTINSIWILMWENRHMVGTRAKVNRACDTDANMEKWNSKAAHATRTLNCRMNKNQNALAVRFIVDQFECCHLLCVCVRALPIIKNYVSLALSLDVWWVFLKIRASNMCLITTSNIVETTHTRALENWVNISLLPTDYLGARCLIRNVN